MAAPEDVKELRGLIAELDDSNGWSDTKLEGVLDAYTTVNGAARQVWLQKAAEAATLVDVSESGSSRKLSDIRKNAMEMAAYFAGLEATEPVVGVPTGPVIARIRRGFT